MENIKKLSFWETAKDGTDLYFKNLELLVLIDIISIIPGLLNSYSLNQGDNKTGTWLGAVFSVFLVLVNQGAVFTALKKRAEGTDTDVWECIKAGIVLLPRVVSAILLQALVVLCGFVMLIVPGFVFLTKYAYVLPAAIFEEKGISPFKLSGALSRGNMGYTFMVIFVTYLVLVLPGEIVDTVFKDNFWPYLILGIPVSLVSTIAQSIHFTAYKKLKENTDIEIKPDNPAIKGMSTASGCLIASAGFSVVTALLVAFAVFFTMYSGTDKIMRSVFGSKAKLTQQLTVNMPQRWYMISDSKIKKSWVLRKTRKKDSPGQKAYLRCVPLSDKMITGLNAKSGIEDKITAIETIEGEYMKKAMREEDAPSWDSYDTFPLIKKGNVTWEKTILYQSKKEPVKMATVYCAIDDGSLVYFYIETDQTDEEAQNAMKAAEEILDMFAPAAPLAPKELKAEKNKKEK